MTLSELLLTLRQDILHDRSDQIEGESDHLWSDTTLVRYINEAQRRFARRSLCLRDGTSALTRFQLTGYQETYALDKRILSVTSARNIGNGQWINGVLTAGAYNTATPPLFVPAAAGVELHHPDTGDLGRGSHSLLMKREVVDTPLYDVNGMDYRAPGKPLAFTTDEYEASVTGGAVSMRLYPLCDARYAGDTIQMRIVRLPLVDLTTTDMQAVPEVPDSYHLDMLDWAAYLALRIVDHELGDPGRAAEFKQSFEAHAEEGRIETNRKIFAPQGWRFGGNGFSYTGN